jgi:hypothetical protein
MNSVRVIEAFLDRTLRPGGEVAQYLFFESYADQLTATTDSSLAE